MRYANSPSFIITLNLMYGLDGIVYANTVDGSSNTLTVLISLKKRLIFTFLMVSPRSLTAITLFLTMHLNIITALGKLSANGWMTWAVL